jgi:hypothetical protein
MPRSACRGLKRSAWPRNQFLMDVWLWATHSQAALWIHLSTHSTRSPRPHPSVAPTEGTLFPFAWGPGSQARWGVMPSHLSEGRHLGPTPSAKPLPRAPCKGSSCPQLHWAPIPSTFSSPSWGQRLHRVKTSMSHCSSSLKLWITGFAFLCHLTQFLLPPDSTPLTASLQPQFLRVPASPRSPPNPVVSMVA